MWYATALLSASDADRTMTQTASCSTKACTMPVMKLVFSDKRLADSHSNTRNNRLSIAGDMLLNVLRAKTFCSKDLPALTGNGIQKESRGYSSSSFWLV